MKKSALLIVLVCALAMLGAQKPWDQEFKPDIDVPEGFRANRTSYSAIMDVLDVTRPEVTLEQLAQLEDLQLENIWASMGEYEDNYVIGFQTARPGERTIGRALTIRSLPSRPDLKRALDTLGEEGDWDTRFYIRAGEEAKPGDVVGARHGSGDVRLRLLRHGYLTAIISAR